jgi:hypothetical protein
MRPVCMVLSWAALATSAAAAPPPEGFGAARLISGSPDFQNCIQGDGDCQANFYRFLGNSMLEQGFAMQHQPLLSSPLSDDRAGFVVGGDLTTFPFAAPRENLSGKQENTSFSPVFPQLVVGWRGAGDESGQTAVGLSFLPPVPVQGASALSLSVDGGRAWGGPEALRFGLEGGLSFVRALAPIVATTDQLENRDQFDNPDNLDPEVFARVCGPDVADGASGCIDRFRLLNLELRAGLSLPLGAFRPFAKLGLTLVNERLDVKYDATAWGVTALQPAVHGGCTWAPGEHIRLALGGSLGLLQGNQSEDHRAGLLGKLVGAAGWAF